MALRPPRSEEERISQRLSRANRGQPAAPIYPLALRTIGKQRKGGARPRGRPRAAVHPKPRVSWPQEWFLRPKSRHRVPGPPTPPNLISALAARYRPFELRVSVMHASGHQSTQLSYSPGDIDIDINMAATIAGEPRPAPRPLPHFPSPPSNPAAQPLSCAKSPNLLQSNLICVHSVRRGRSSRANERRAQQAHTPSTPTLSSSLPHAHAAHTFASRPSLHLPRIPAPLRTRPARP